MGWPTAPSTGGLAGLEDLQSALDGRAWARAVRPRESHARVRAASGMARPRLAVEPILPADVLEVCVYLPEVAL